MNNQVGQQRCKEQPMQPKGGAPDRHTSSPGYLVEQTSVLADDLDQANESLDG